MLVFFFIHKIVRDSKPFQNLFFRENYSDAREEYYESRYEWCQTSYETLCFDGVYVSPCHNFSRRFSKADLKIKNDVYNLTPRIFRDREDYAAARRKETR